MKQSTILRLLTGVLFFMGTLIPSLRAQMDSLMVVSPINPDRPSQADGAFLAPKGYFQMENGFSIVNLEPGFLYTYPCTVWKVGVNENLELRVITDYINIQHEGTADVKGLLPVQVGFKAKLLDQKGIIPQAAFLGHISLPGIASKQFETTYFAPSMSVAFENDFARTFYVFYNGGAKWNGEDPRPSFFYAGGGGISGFHGFGAYLEVYGDVPQQRESDFHHRLDGGLTYLVTNDVMVDVSGGIGLSDNAPEKYVAVGFSYRFKM